MEPTTTPPAAANGPVPHPAASDGEELDRLLTALPSEVRDALQALSDWDTLVEIVLDIGRFPEARLDARSVALLEREVTGDDLDQVVSSVGAFTADNRAGIARTLHRFSALRNRSGRIVGLTIRRGRALHGTTHVVADIITSPRNLLLLGPPGVGKTTMLREIARVLANDADRRVVVVDTSNEIAGDGDIPHAGIGRARRMQVAQPDLQHRVMIEAVENHMPEVVVVDEIGTEAEARAARTIAERGVQLVATAHGQTLENVLLNPLLADLVGGVEAVTLGDEEARRRGTQKTVLERRAPPSFHTLIELHSRDSFVIYTDVAETVDAVLRGLPAPGERRVRLADGRTEREAFNEPPRDPERPAAALRGTDPTQRRRASSGSLQILPFGVGRNRLEQAIINTGIDARLVRDLGGADVVMTLRSFFRRRPRLLRDAEARGTPVYVLRSNTVLQMESCLMELVEDGATVDGDAPSRPGSDASGPAQRLRLALTKPRS
ncbi:MAG: AAA family ATPase [Chloroflexi bacterium]|nr:AAA family ATPase [Chloroflexota bacterium]